MQSILTSLVHAAGEDVEDDALLGSTEGLEDEAKKTIDVSWSAAFAIQAGMQKDTVEGGVDVNVQEDGVDPTLSVEQWSGELENAGKGCVESSPSVKEQVSVDPSASDTEELVHTAHGNFKGTLLAGWRVLCRCLAKARSALDSTRTGILGGMEAAVAVLSGPAGLANSHMGKVLTNLAGLSKLRHTVMNHYIVALGVLTALSGSAILVKARNHFQLGLKMLAKEKELARLASTMITLDTLKNQRPVGLGLHQSSNFMASFATPSPASQCAGMAV
eukprot:gene17052-23347_t